MICEKTGANVWLNSHGESIRGDVFRLPGDVLLIRVTNASRGDIPKTAPFNYIVHTVERWFDEGATYGTIISRSSENLGYEGQNLVMEEGEL